VNVLFKQLHVHTHSMEALKFFYFRQPEFPFSYLYSNSLTLGKVRNRLITALISSKFHLLKTTTSTSWTFFLLSATVQERGQDNGLDARSEQINSRFREVFSV
jgi:hypothetical protein